VSNVLLRLKTMPGQVRLRLEASDYALKLRLVKTPRQSWLRHSQSENLRRIGNYVANQLFFYENFGSSILSLSLTLNVEP